MFKYLSPVRVVSRLITPTIHVPDYHRGSTRLNSPLLTNRVYGLMMLSRNSYTCIRPIQLETRFVKPGNVFPVINSSMVVLTAQVRRQALCGAVNTSGTRVGL
ncbi:hypothetical protein AVEN_139467-1 [Araneus ventricosus]|uniref:Uncharacterized protein n=1 Tax=Araneus ventricosus TaxID=182803 RepID=A0A4Y2RDX8_ARAVE|nr:hypothetical protein AVEN_56426-1 [Araneus ventricosus]GBN73939.1 hypothetical protein AVEN_139467-1 [Araneus ventricosus]